MLFTNMLREETGEKTENIGLTEATDMVTFLRGCFRRRREEDKYYSVRRFAKDIGLSPGALSEILARKRRVTTQTAIRLCDGLRVQDPSRSQLLESILTSEESSHAALGNSKRERRLHSVNEDHFALISDWYHFGLLSLIETSSFEFNRGQIAQRLGITTVEVSEAFERLLRLKLVEEKDGKVIPTYYGVRSPDGAAEVKNAHRQLLKKALEALETVPTTHRDITAVTLAIDPKRITKAKELIRRFRKRMSKYLEAGDRSSVYILNIQLVPSSIEECRL